MIPPHSNTDNPHARMERLPHGSEWAWALTFSRRKPSQFRALIDDLKKIIPSYDRTYDPQSYTWFIAAGYVAGVETITNRYGVDIYVIGDDGLDGGAHRAHALRELYLLPTAPQPVIDAVYRTLAKQYHPDRGGDTAAMQRLNQIMETLR